MMSPAETPLIWLKLVQALAQDMPLCEPLAELSTYHVAPETDVTSGQIMDKTVQIHTALLRME